MLETLSKAMERVLGVQVNILPDYPREILGLMRNLFCITSSNIKCYRKFGPNMKVLISAIMKCRGYANRTRKLMLLYPQVQSDEEFAASSFDNCGVNL